jgi:hypothetical protein
MGLRRGTDTKLRKRKYQNGSSSKARGIMNYVKKILTGGTLAGMISGGVLGSALLLLAAGPAHAQEGPKLSGIGPAVEANLGFEYVDQEVPGQTTRVPMFGVDAGMTVGVTSRFGVRADLAYARSGAVFGSGSHSDITSYLACPVFYPVLSRRMAPYMEILAGGARVTGATPDVMGGYVRGFSNKFAWAGGGGIEVRAWRTSSVRIGADYLHTSYFDPNVAVRGQGNIRALVSWTHYFGGGYSTR